MSEVRKMLCPNDTEFKHITRKVHVKGKETTNIVKK